MVKAKQKLRAEGEEIIAKINSQRDAVRKVSQTKATKEAAPFLEAKLKAQKNVVQYVTKAKELANAVIPLKNQSMQIAQKAQKYICDYYYYSLRLLLLLNTITNNNTSTI